MSTEQSVRAPGIMNTSYKKILIPRFDTMGDIIIFSGVLDALLDEFPDVEITMMVMEKMNFISTIMNPRLRWWPVSAQIHRDRIDHLYTGDLDFQALTPVLDEINRSSFDLLLSPLYSQTFLGSYIARASRIEQRIGFASGDNFVRSKVPAALQGSLNHTTHTLTVEAREWSPEIEKNHRLFEAVVQRKTAVPRPKLHLGQQASAWADQYVAETIKEKNGSYAVLFPGAGHHFRSWPRERYAGIASWLQSEKDIVPIVAGSPFDRKSLDEVRDAFFEKTGTLPRIIEFAPSELDRFMALLAKASLYIGNDTGPMHASAALGVPVIGLFGGGTWGRFYPYGEKCIVVSHEMPCYQCGWNCVEGHYSCMKMIEEETVRMAVDHALAGTTRWQFGQPYFITNHKIADRISAQPIGFSKKNVSVQERITESMKTAVKKIIRKLRRHLAAFVDWS